MGFQDIELDISKNIRIIEKQKYEIVISAGNLLKSLSVGNGNVAIDNALESLTDIVLFSYILGKRLGLSINEIENKLDKKLRLGALNSDNSNIVASDIKDIIEYRTLQKNKKRV